MQVMVSNLKKKKVDFTCKFTLELSQYSPGLYMQKQAHHIDSAILRCLHHLPPCVQRCLPVQREGWSSQMVSCCCECPEWRRWRWEAFHYRKRRYAQCSWFLWHQERWRRWRRWQIDRGCKDKDSFASVISLLSFTWWLCYLKEQPSIIIKTSCWVWEWIKTKQTRRGQFLICLLKHIRRTFVWKGGMAKKESVFLYEIRFCRQWE